MMQLRKIISVFMALLLVSVSALSGETDSLQSALQGIMHQHKIPDLSVSVIRSGKIVYAADLHQQNDGTLQIGPGVTRFRIASITKLFTAQAAMQLIEKRTLSLDDKVAVYIPELKNSHITIQHLLTHHGGLEDKVWPEPFSE
jgi:Beta-lactamase class C and other penicillin binding proteins